MGIKSSVNQRKSRMVQGGLTDRYAQRLGWWERAPMETADSDSLIEIQAKEQHRPDLVAYRLYGDPRLSWVVLQFNNIIDIETEFTTGVELRVPSHQRVVLDFTSQPTGGKIIK